MCTSAVCCGRSELPGQKVFGLDLRHCSPWKFQSCLGELQTLYKHSPSCCSHTTGNSWQPDRQQNKPTGEQGSTGTSRGPQARAGQRWRQALGSSSSELCTLLGHEAGCLQCTCHSLGTTVLGQSWHQCWISSLACGSACTGSCGWVGRNTRDGLHADGLFLDSSPGGRGEYELSPAQPWSPECGGLRCVQICNCCTLWIVILRLFDFGISRKEELTYQNISKVSITGLESSTLDCGYS